MRLNEHLCVDVELPLAPCVMWGPHAFSNGHIRPSPRVKRWIFFRLAV